MEYSLRNLKSDDMFLMFGILSKIGFKEIKDTLTPDRVKDILSAFKNVDSESKLDDMSIYLGFNLTFDAVEIILKNLPACKMEIYSLLASLSDMTAKDIADLDMVTFTQMLIDVLQKDDFKDFFKVVAKLFN